MVDTNPSADTAGSTDAAETAAVPASVTYAGVDLNNLDDDAKDACWRSPFCDEWLAYLYGPDASSNSGSGEAMNHLSEKFGNDPRWKVYHRAYQTVRRNETAAGRILHDIITETEIVYAAMMRKIKAKRNAAK